MSYVTQKNQYDYYVIIC